jgi:HD-GYP domain-containing protein (c-di-GMP phosphodiesterase class II)
MTTARIYQRASTPEQAKQEIVTGSGTRYDPTIVQAFLTALVQLSVPAGSVV